MPKRIDPRALAVAGFQPDAPNPMWLPESDEDRRVYALCVEHYAPTIAALEQARDALAQIKLDVMHPEDFATTTGQLDCIYNRTSAALAAIDEKS